MPSCGVEIAGHIIKCSHCGELYLKEETSCPNCHHTESHFEPSVNTTEQKSNELSNEHATAAPAVVVAVDKNEANEEKEAERLQLRRNQAITTLNHSSLSKTKGLRMGR